MRVLFSVYPFPGHLFPVVSTAWALRAAGHDVLLASVGGRFETVTATGLPAVEVADAAEIEAVFERYSPVYRQGAAEGEGTDAPPLDDNPVTGLLADWSRTMAEGTVQVAERWRPDLVIHDVVMAAGPLAAAKIGVPAVEHVCGFHPSTIKLTDVMHMVLQDLYQRHGVAGLPARRATWDVVPPSMSAIAEHASSVRYVPYGGGGMLPDRLVGGNPRPRVAVTLGTTTPQLVGMSPFRSMIDAARDVDAEFVLALGGADPAPLGELPDNVHTCGWVPLHALLDGCSAIIHQGGVGTTLSALHCGVPQLALPTGSDNFINADAVRDRGLGLTAEVSAVDSELLMTLIHDEGLHTEAAAVRAEMMAQPSPADVIGGLFEDA